MHVSQCHIDSTMDRLICTGLLLISRTSCLRHPQLHAVHLVINGLPDSSGTCWRSASVTFLVPFASRWNLHKDQ